MTIALEALMLLSSLLIVIGGLRAQRLRKSRGHHGYGATLLSIVGAAVVFAIAFYTGAVRDARVGLLVGAGLLLAALLYARAYRLSASA